MHRQYSLLQETPHILHRNYQGRLWQSARETPFGMHIWTLGGVAYFMTIVTTPALTVQALGGAIMDTLTVWRGITLEFSKYFHDRQYYEIVCTISNKLLPSPRRTSLCMVMRLFCQMTRAQPKCASLELLWILSHCSECSIADTFNAIHNTW